ncbi:QacE family quaternary ammonium compound efflux SMR transporter [Nocardiopsis eucommiae]|uniref:QacE family quaternary ammonium compound efflux SMR transporter n=1 Tax=Nocardiopsis eucommiae TaxID=2831970 RepID=A0A975L8R9_9ACTN|nr:QacE family quaternary ammonium compound efflux SMR transporter [Nocardiopsis eucommiae]
MAWLFLAAALLTEMVGATATGLSEGFTRPVAVLVAVPAVLVAYFMLALALKRGMAVGVAYGLWTSSGVAIVAVIGLVLLGDELTMVQVGGLVLVMTGALALELGRARTSVASEVPGEYSEA